MIENQTTTNTYDLAYRLQTEATYRNDESYDYRIRRIKRTENGYRTDVVFLGGTSAMEFESAEANVAPDYSQPTVEYVRGSDWGR